MTKQWAHFDRKQCPITTNDLHLSWDIPCTGEPVVVVGYDENDQIVSRTELLPPAEATHLTAEPDQPSVAGTGEDVIQIEIALRDKLERIVTNADQPVSVSVGNGTLLSLDNGDPSDHTLYSDPCRNTFRGRALAVIRADSRAETVSIRISAENLAPAEITVPVIPPANA